MKKSEKLEYKGKFYWISSEDLNDPSVKKLFVYKDKDLTKILKTISGKTVIVDKNNLNDKLKEGYGAGFSFTGGYRSMLSGTRGGFGGANNLGGPNMMYTYEIKPLNHTLEQRPITTETGPNEIRLGSKISGYPVRSNATPDKKRIQGIVKSIQKTDDGAIKYYVIFDEATMNVVKIDPLSTELIIHEPVEYYFDATDSIPSKRRQKIKSFVRENKIVPESLKELSERKNTFLK